MGPSDVITTPGGAARTPGREGSSRFTPGAVLAGRYRLVALLGRGGMGEVYRADDLTLDHPVALKFLPERAVDPDHLARFHNELRIARQVSHKNVCRLYDLGDADDRRFTGRRAYEAKTLNELVALQQSGTISTPSSVVRDLDPAIERVILRCLERDPALRPGCCCSSRFSF